VLEIVPVMFLCGGVVIDGQSNSTSSSSFIRRTAGVVVRKMLVETVELEFWCEISSVPKLGTRSVPRQWRCYYLETVASP